MNVEQELFLLARRTKVRASHESMISNLRRMLGTMAMSAAAVCSTGLLLGSASPATPLTTGDVVYPSSSDNHQAAIEDKHPTQMANLLV